MEPSAFLTTVYVIVDDLYREMYGESVRRRRGRPAKLSDSEVITLSLLARWLPVSERGFIRFAARYLRPFFPALAQSTFNERSRRLAPRTGRLAVEAGARLFELAGRSGAGAMDATCVPLMRRCRGGRAALFTRAQAWFGRGGSDREAFYGVKLALLVDEEWLITGFAACAGNVEERWLAESLLRMGSEPGAALPPAEEMEAVLGPSHKKGGRRKGAPGPVWGAVSGGHQTLLADRGYSGSAWLAHWEQDLSVRVVVPDNCQQHGVSARELKSKRQRVETVFRNLKHTFGLDRLRTRGIAGTQARVAAVIGAHNLSVLANKLFGNLHHPLALNNPLF